MVELDSRAVGSHTGLPASDALIGTVLPDSIALIPYLKEICDSKDHLKSCLDCSSNLDDTTTTYILLLQTFGLLEPHVWLIRSREGGIRRIRRIPTLWNICLITPSSSCPVFLTITLMILLIWSTTLLCSHPKSGQGREPH